MIDDYTRLLEIAAESSNKRVQEQAVKKLINHLKSVGQVRMLSKILKELRKIETRRTALAPIVEVAHKKESVAALRAAKKVGIKADKAVINTSLIRGFRAQGAGILVDQSAKAALLEIYKSATA